MTDCVIPLYRGRKRILIEKRIEENRLAVEEVLRRIKELPRNAPERVRDGLWQTYEELNFGYQSQTRRLLSAPQPKQLPPASDQGSSPSPMTSSG
jgi:hypothetical protein